MTISKCERVLCSDSESLLHPEMLGLEGESLSSQPWLRLFSDAQEVREYIKSAQNEIEVWIVRCDQMEGINLAAALKRDRPEIEVSLIDFNPSGSLFSRARVAGITAVMDKDSFLNRYQWEKRSYTRFLLEEAEKNEGKAIAHSREKHSFQVGNEPHHHVLTTPYDVQKTIPTSQITQQIMPSGMPIVQRLDDRSEANAANSSEGLLSAEKKTPSRADGSFVLSVVGAGGGTGKSTIATLCGLYALKKGMKTVIIDADLQFGDIAYLCGVESPVQIDDLAENPLRIEGASSQTLSIVAAPKNLERSEMVSDCFDQVFSLLCQRYDVVIVNTGSAWGDVHMQLLEASTYSLFVLDQRPSSIRSCKHVLELCSRCGIASQSFVFAINRCSRKALFSGSDIAGALQGARVFELKDGGRLVEEQLGIGQPADLFDAGNGLTESISAMMDELLPDKRQDTDFLMGPSEKKGRRGIRRKKKK